MSTLTVKQTDRIKVNFAVIGLNGLNQRILAQITEPLLFMPEILEFNLKSMYGYSVDGYGPMVADRILSKFQDVISSAPEQEALPHWIREISSVETVECDLLVPKYPARNS